MIYSVWDDGVSFTFIEDITLPANLCEPGAFLLKTFEADSYNDAMRQYHAWQGWEPYKPMEDLDGQ